MTVTAVSKSQRAYQWIRDGIDRREFTPGYRLVLGTIAQGLGMSVVPVREAIRRLEAEGLVEYERNVGARVRLVDEAEYFHAMQSLGIVEGAATRLALPYLVPERVEEARRTNERMAELLEHFDPHAFTALNRRFHASLFEACPNPQLLDFVDRSWRRLSGLRDSTFAFVPERARESVAEHTQLLDLIGQGGDPAEIEDLVRTHRWRTMDALLTTRHAEEET